MAATIIYYEQPLNELIRACLRIEYLYQIIKHNITNSSPWASHSALEAIISTMNILDRADLKTKFLAEFRRSFDYYQQFKNNPDINTDKLKGTLESLEKAMRILTPPSGKFAQELREQPFIAAMKQHLSTPGGTCNADVPLYHHWLHLPADQRKDHLQTWFNELTEAYEIVNAMLELARQHVSEQSYVATEGFYQMHIEPSNHNKLIARIGLSSDCDLYPVVSVGKYRLSIYFFQGKFSERPEQTTENVPFVMAY